MRNGKPAQMVFAAFDRVGDANGVLERLEQAGFKRAGFGAIGAERDRAEPMGSGMLSELFSQMSHAPSLSVDGSDVAGAGSLPTMLELAPSGMMGGLQAALQNQGASLEQASAMADAVRNRGLVVGVATEDTERAKDAIFILEMHGAHHTLSLDVASA